MVHVLVVSKYPSPWSSVVLVKNIILKYNADYISPKRNVSGMFILILYLFKLNFQLFTKTKKNSQVFIYNDMLLVIFTYPVLKMMKWMKNIDCYYLFESKWFSKNGDFFAHFFISKLNTDVYKKIFVFDGLLRKYLEEKGLESEKVIEIGIGVDSKIFRPQPHKSFSYTLLYVGAIDKRRKLDLMIDSLEIVAKSYPKVKLLIVGSGNDLVGLREFVQLRGLEKNVTFVGYIDHSKIPKYVKQSDVCLAQYPPELYDIQLPYKTFEYMACKRPVITTRTLSTSKYFRDGEDALLTKFNAMDMAMAINKLFSDSALRRKLSEGALRKSKEFNWPSVFKKISAGLK
jgi:glycosyltransferase involved in cell wall biosynthesis